MNGVVRYCNEYVCLSVRKDISGTTHAIFTKFFVHVAYDCGSVLLWHVDDRPHHLSAGRVDGSAQRGRSVIYNCLVSIRFLPALVRNISHLDLLDFITVHV